MCWLFIAASVLSPAVRSRDHSSEQSTGSRVHGLQYLQHTRSAVVERGLSCPMACGIFLERGLNPCPLHWQADSYPLCHQGSPLISSFFKRKIVFVYLAALGLHCSTQDLQSSLWHVGSVSWSMWDLVPRPGIKPGPSTLGTWRLSH